MEDSSENSVDSSQDTKTESEGFSTTNCPKTGNGEMQALLVEDYPDMSPAMQNLMSSLESPTLDEIAVMLLYILTVETGFVPFPSVVLPGDEDCGYNVRRIRSLTASPHSWKKQDGVYHIYFVLAPYPEEKCHLVCAPLGAGFLANMYCSCSEQSFVMFVNPADYVALYPNQIIFKRLKYLSLTFKKQVVIPTRTVMFNDIHQTNVGLFSLPVEVLLKIISYLQVTDFLKWTSTCKYFFHTFSYDEGIWKQFCQSKFLRPSELRSKETHREYYKRKINFRNRVSCRFPLSEI